MVKKKELARLLGISPAMVSRHAAAGMPTDDLLKAQRWRARHLEPTRTKHVRADYAAAASPPEAPVQTSARPTDGQILEAIERAATLCLVNFDRHRDELRGLMRALPASRRLDLRLPAGMLERLIGAPCMAFLDGCEAEVAAERKAEGKEPHPVQTDAEVDAVALLFYELACGERTFIPDPAG